MSLYYFSAFCLLKKLGINVGVGQCVGKRVGDNYSLYFVVQLRLASRNIGEVQLAVVYVVRAVIVDRSYGINTNRNERVFDGARFFVQLAPRRVVDTLVKLAVPARQFVGRSFAVLAEYEFACGLRDYDRKLQQFVVHAVVRVPNPKDNTR